MNDFKSVAVEAALKAGKLQLTLADNDIAFQMKGERDILAEGDLQSEKIILGMIKQHFPNHSIWSEESGKEIFESEYLWVINPIDGTINFSRGNEEYCASIGLSHNGVMILSVIYQPALGKLYVAEKGKGAFLNDERLRRKMIIRLSILNF